MKIISTTLLVALIITTSAHQPEARQEPQDPNSPPSEETPQQTQPEAPAPQPPPPPAPAPKPVTLGEFVMKVATGMNLHAPTGGFTPESAAWALSLKGTKVRPDLSSSLTEADAVSVLTGMGYKIRTATPSRVLTSDRVNLLLETFIPQGKY